MLPKDSIFRKLIPPSLAVIIMPFSLLIALATLTFIAVKIGVSNISSQRRELEKVQKDENILQGKETLLRRVSDVVLSKADASLGAVPENNSSLLVISQLKSLAVGKGVAITDFKIGNIQKGENNISATDIGFEIEGTTLQAFDFVNSISSFSPLTTIEKVKMDQVAGATRMEVLLKSYWATLPKTLPPLTQQLNELTTDEQDTLTKLSSLTQPPFVSVAPASPSARLDPFSL